MGLLDDVLGAAMPRGRATRATRRAARLAVAAWVICSAA